MPRKVPLSMRSVGSSDDGAVIRVATAWLDERCSGSWFGLGL